MCSRIKYYIILSKPCLVYLLFFTGFAAMVIAGSIYGYNWTGTAILSAAIILGVMGSNAMTNFVDREMDIIMERTKKRPIPAGKIKPRHAFIYSLIMVIAGILLAGYVNIWSALFILMGFINSAIIYNWLTKRKTPANIILGAPAGGFPVLAGWIGISGRLEALPLLLFILIMIWTPIHIWSLAYFYKEDYKKAGIPMLPVIIGSMKIHIILSVLDFAMVGFSIYIGLRYDLSPVYLAGSGILGLVIIVFSLQLMIKGSKKTAWLLFKLTSPYLAVIFILLIIEYVFIK
ncbi:MAG TPA: protoheme IX farnesyltransferase [Actinobacteria bacterium]|nr:protoheme IX farnesyltransferase [Actinomycetota bacterium]